MDEHDQQVTAVDAGAARAPKLAAVSKPHSHLERRTQRLEELTIDALDEADPLRATVKAATAQLLDIVYRLGDEIKANVHSGQHKSPSRQDGPGAISTLMLVHRQITRYVQLDQQWARENPSTEPPGHRSAEPKEAD